MKFEEEVQSVCEHAFKVLRQSKLKFRPMKRTKSMSMRRSFAIGRTNLRTKLITIDILTPKKREPKKISSILHILAHEIAHHQKKPFRAYFKGAIINRQHYPSFYRQVKRNMIKLKNDKLLKQYFS